MRSSLGMTLAGLAAQVTAHGYIQTFKVDGTEYPGFAKGNPNNGDIIGWSFSTPDEGPVMDETSPNMICRHDGMNAALSAKAQPGSKLDFRWVSDDWERNRYEWAESHHGPILTYIAPCNGDCATVDKSTLKFVKISEADIISGPASEAGTWATDQMRAHDGWNSAVLPENIAPGNYVVRNEIIALHKAHDLEPEFYMICGNLEVEGSGTDNMAGGISATQLYNRDMAIFGFSQYGDSKIEWEMPGPALYEGAAAGGSAPSAPVANEPQNQGEEEQGEEEEEDAPGNGDAIDEDAPVTTIAVAAPVATGSLSENANANTNNPSNGNISNNEDEAPPAGSVPPFVTKPQIPTEGDDSPTPGNGKGKNSPCKIGEKGRKEHGYGSDRRHPRDFV